MIKEGDTNNDGVLEFHEFSAFWKDTLGDAGDEMIKSATKSKKAGGGGKKPKEKALKLETMDELNLRVAQELTKGQDYEKQAFNTDAATFERRLGAALIRSTEHFSASATLAPTSPLTPRVCARAVCAARPQMTRTTY